MRPGRQAILLAAAASGLGGCGEGSSTVQPARNHASAALEQRFGESFTAMSRASPNSKPRDVTASDLPPVSLTDKPIEF